MNFGIGKFQLKVLVLIQTGPASTYELSRATRKDFHYVRAACVSLWHKGYLDNKKNKWALMPQTKVGSMRDSLPDYSGFGGFSY